MLKLTLHHCPNPDIAGGYYKPPVDPQELSGWVSTVVSASLVYRQWIERNGLGGGNMAMDSGLLFIHEGTEPFARVSYNGNVWLAEDGRKLYDVKWQMALTNCAPEGWGWQ